MIDIAVRNQFHFHHKILLLYHKFVEMIVKRGHLSVIEHCSITVRFINDRGVSHEEVRHRLSSFSQESTRYCNYSKKGMQYVEVRFGTA